MADHGGWMWSRIALWTLKKLCKVDHKIIGLEKLPDEPFIVACKHQSMWETVVMNVIFDRPAYAYKKELLKIPFYGWYLRIMTGIKVDRQGGAASIRDLVRQTKDYLKIGRKIVIFPQGTRVPLDGKTDRYPYQPGIAALYLSCNVKVIPVVLDSGLLWPRNNMITKPGTITLEFLDPIEPGLPKKEFLQKLEKVIEEKSESLLENSK